MKLKDSELKSILAEVEQEIGALLKSEGDALKKAKDEDASEATESPESAPAEAGAPPEASSAPGPEASAPAPEMSAAPEASAPAPEASAPAPGGDPAAAAGPVDPAMLQAEYSKLPPEELKAHYMAAKAALFELMGAGGGAGPEASAPMAPEASAPAPAPAPAMAAPAMAPPASPEAPPPAFKAEVPATMTNNPANGALKDQAPTIPDAIKSEKDQGVALRKSESDAKMEDLQAQVDLMAKALDIALGTPIRKAVTSVAYLPKSEVATEVREPTKVEAKDKIRKAMESGKLSKSDKEKLFSFSLGNLSFDQVKDLLDTK